MRIPIAVLVVAASAMLSVVQARAQQPMQPAGERQARPGMAALAAASNVVYAPVRLAMTVVNAGFGGLTGWLVFDDTRAAADVFAIGTGQGFLQPEMFTGEESLQVGEVHYNLQVAKP